MITPLNVINRTENFGYSVQKSPINDVSANNMPNGLLRVPQIDNSKNMSNLSVNDYRKNIFTTHLSPSTGSLTESFIKARSLFSPVYRNNEAISKYEAVSLGPLMLKQVKKDLDRII
tara:strand:- start:52 stop:402 length:351 start_codon:yes stop_codon:yes gene_type:complete